MQKVNMASTLAGAKESDTTLDEYLTMRTDLAGVTDVEMSCHDVPADISADIATMERLDVEAWRSEFQRLHDELRVLEQTVEELRSGSAAASDEIRRSYQTSKRLPFGYRFRHWLEFLRCRPPCNYQDFKLLKESALFDERYYLDRNPDVASAGDNPVSHYLNFGASEGRDPSLGFCELAYKRLHPDVLKSRMPGLIHFERFGRIERRTAPSVPQELLSLPRRNSDVPDNRAGVSAPLQKEEILAQRRAPAIIDDKDWQTLRPLVLEHFDPDWYLNTYRDLGDLSAKKALEHFVKFGSAELRNPNASFDSSYYAKSNPDTSEKNPWAHYLLHGKSEGRQPKVFGIDDLRDRAQLLENVYSGLKEQGGSKPSRRLTKRVCCLVHIYYGDLTNELLDYIENIESEKDVFINLVSTTWEPEVHQAIFDRFPEARVLISPDHGRDIGGFARLLSITDVSDYDVFFFAHSKKSPHLPPNVGIEWRRGLLEPLVGTPEAASLCINQMRANDRLGLIGAAKWRCSDVLANSAKYNELLALACVSAENRKCDFVSGTMFFISHRVVTRLRLILRSITFEDGHNAPLSFHMDGQYAHAVERLIGNLVTDEGLFTWYKSV